MATLVEIMTLCNLFFSFLLLIGLIVVYAKNHMVETILKGLIAQLKGQPKMPPVGPAGMPMMPGMPQDQTSEVPKS
jgi:hypothetical protein